MGTTSAPPPPGASARVSPSQSRRLVPAAPGASGRSAASRPRAGHDGERTGRGQVRPHPSTPASDQPASLAMVTVTGRCRVGDDVVGEDAAVLRRQQHRRQRRRRWRRSRAPRRRGRAAAAARRPAPPNAAGSSSTITTLRDRLGEAGGHRAQPGGQLGSADPAGVDALAVAGERRRRTCARRSPARAPWTSPTYGQLRAGVPAVEPGVGRCRHPGAEARPPRRRSVPRRHRERRLSRPARPAIVSARTRRRCDSATMRAGAPVHGRATGGRPSPTSRAAFGQPQHDGLAGHGRPRPGCPAPCGGRADERRGEPGRGGRRRRRPAVATTAVDGVGRPPSAARARCR